VFGETALRPITSRLPKFVVAFLVGSLIGCRAILGPSQGAPIVTTTPKPTPTISDIEKYARLTMPASARDIHAYVDPGFLDSIVILTFKLAPEDLPAFLADAGYPDPLQPVWNPLAIPGYYDNFRKLLPAWPSRADWVKPSRTRHASCSAQR